MYSRATRGHFFRSPDLSSSYTTGTQECCIQIPSAKDIQQMRGMPAGADEDQCQRLTHMVQKIEQIKAQHASLPIMHSVVWEVVFVF